MSKRPPPPSTRIPKNTGGEPIFTVEEIHVGSWGPLPDGKGPSTEVHVSVIVRQIPYPLVLRFKTKEYLDQVIETLQAHRADVWPTP